MQSCRCWLDSWWMERTVLVLIDNCFFAAGFLSCIPLLVGYGSFLRFAIVAGMDFLLYGSLELFRSIEL